MFSHTFIKRKPLITVVIVLVIALVGTSFWSTNLFNIQRYVLEKHQLHLPENQVLENLNNKTTKKFLYLLQTETCIPDYLKDSKAIGNPLTCNCDVLVLGYVSLCKEASPKHIQYVHDPNTTWSTGRNRLHDIAMKRPTEYSYYIFMDDDILLKQTWKNDSKVNSTRSNSWRIFEGFLLEYTPPVGITGYCYTNYVPPCKKPTKPTVIQIQGIFDAAFNAFHFKALPYLIPYVTKYENISWWYSQHYLANFASVNFNGKGVVSNEAITAVNIKHRNYPRKVANVKTIKFIREDVVGMVKRKNLPKIVWQGKNVTQAVRIRKKCSCYS